MPAKPHDHDSVEMPRPTAWPIVIALAVTLLALGAATSLAFCIIGAALLIISLFGWISQLLPGRGHEHEPLAEPAERAKPVAPRHGTVEPLKPGVIGYRFQLPEKVHPISAGIKGGIVGGILMPIPAIVWGIWSGHTIWFPVNLLSGMVIPGLSDLPPEKLVPQLEAFHPWLFVGAAVMHVVMSVGFGLVGGVLLPTLPRIPGGPLLFGGLILPLLWSGANHSMMGLVNPILNHYIQWPWYVASQLVYGIAASIVIMRSEEIPIAPRGSGADGGGPSIPSGLVGCLIASCFLSSGCNDNFPGKPNPADVYRLPQDVTKFAPLYALRCAGCHGADGTAGAGPPLNDALYLSLVTDDELHHIIADGRAGTLMPAWSEKNGGPLTEKQVTALIEGIRANWQAGDANELPKNAPPLMPPASAASSTAAATSTATAGAKVWTTACAGCHGPNGEGADIGGALHDPAFLALSSDQVLRRYIITGRSDLSEHMPGFAETDGRDENFKPLTAQDVTDLVALLAQWRADGKRPTRTMSEPTE